ncbi:MAG TPA: phosphate acyltransferase PlsX [Acidimicrobiales bacterium]|nr:phosphate acyltransferase PlsX [Acidimicrobiales bacterium]
MKSPGAHQGGAKDALPVAVDAMGGDFAPDAIVEGARRAHEEFGLPVLLVGDPERIGEQGDLDLLAASETIAMDEDPAQAVRRKKDSSLVRAAEAVRDGRASAMVSAGNTGAAMASALLRIGRIRGVLRPAIATPIPNMSGPLGVLLDAGANAECSAPMLVQFAQMGAAYASARSGTLEPKVALLSIGEEKSKGTPTVKEAHGLLERLEDLHFIGNVEGRELLRGTADVVVTDGFTGNVALKALEGALRFFMDLLAGVFATDEDTKKASEVLLPHLVPIADVFEPDNTGGAMLLGINGICVISHGSSSAKAIVSAVRTAHDLAAGGLVERLESAIKPESAGP